MLTTQTQYRRYHYTFTMDVTGKAVFLTGGSRGIGRALGESLLKRGAKVFFCDINASIGEATEAELQKQYGVDNIIFAQCDVANADQLTGVFKKAVDRFGAVDICVNNAGLGDEKFWEHMVAVNMMAQIRGCLLALEHMRRDKGGRGGVIINTVSIAGVKAAYTIPIYCATKHAMIGFAQSYAINSRMQKMGVRWGSVCPGPVGSDFDVNFKEDQAFEAEQYRIIREEHNTQPEVVAEAFMTLLQDEDSNGAIMVVWPSKFGIKYMKRQLVDSGGVSNPVMVDI